MACNTFTPLQVETYKSFRPGDIVLAKVVSFDPVVAPALFLLRCPSFLLLTLDPFGQISLGDVQSNYLLTTAENELGVVVAHSEAGEWTRPLERRQLGLSDGRRVYHSAER